MVQMAGGRGKYAKYTNTHNTVATSGRDAKEEQLFAMNGPC